MPHTIGNKNAYALASRPYMKVMGPSKFNIEDSFGTDIVVTLFKTMGVRVETFGYLFLTNRHISINELLDVSLLDINLSCAGTGCV